MFRKSCGVCHFTNMHRPSDITIADYWGWEKTDPEINKDDKGVSLVFCNTEKGRELFDSVSDRMVVIPAELDNIWQRNLEFSTPIHPLRLAFEEDYKKHGFEYVICKYGFERSKLKKLKLFFKEFLKKYFRSYEI